MLDLAILLQPINNPFKLIEGSIVFCGLWMNSKLAWMVIYEIKYYHNAGIDYLHYGKKYVKYKNLQLKKSAD
jgi:hypothetical protein